MTPTISAAEAALTPVSSDAQLAERVTDLLERAHQRQVWMLFLDEDDIQLPLLVPISDYPIVPADEQAALLATRMAALMREIGAASLVLTWERYAGQDLTPSDRAWAAAMRTACADAGVVLRAQLLCHRTGVRLLPSAEGSWSAEDG